MRRIAVCEVQIVRDLREYLRFAAARVIEARGVYQSDMLTVQVKLERSNVGSAFILSVNTL